MRTSPICKNKNLKNKYTSEELIFFQSQSLEFKIEWTKQKIQECYEKYNGQVYGSFSGGVDSVVLLDIIWSLYPEVSAVFCDTGLEWPEIRDFVKTFGDKVIWIKPKMNFKRVLEKYGYPVVSKQVSQQVYEYRNSKSEYMKHRILNGTEKSGYKIGKLALKHQKLLQAPFKISHMCCHYLKKQPFILYERETNRKPFIGDLASDSVLRKSVYLKYGCNAFDTKRPKSNPLSIWTKSDILTYIKEKQIPYCKIYGNIKEQRGKIFTTLVKGTGCIFCGFGLHMIKGDNHFQIMYKIHPELHKYCMEQLGMKEVLDFCGWKTEPDKGIIDFSL